MVQCGPLTQCHYLFREGGLLQLNVCLGIGQDGLQRLAQELLIKVLVLPHQRTEGHRHLHLHARKVLRERKWQICQRIWRRGQIGSQLNVHQLAFCSAGSRYDLGLSPYLFPLFGSVAKRAECPQIRMKSTWDQYLQASGHTSEKKKNKSVAEEGQKFTVWTIPRHNT